MGRVLRIASTRRFLLAWAGLALAAIVFVPTALAVFSVSASTSGNAFTTGTVTLADNDAGSAILALAVAHPGDSASGCIKVTYSGSLAATTRLYATFSGTGLESYLTLKVTRGTVSSGSFPACTGFTADATNYIGSGSGVIYNGVASASRGKDTTPTFSWEAR